MDLKKQLMTCLLIFLTLFLFILYAYGLIGQLGLPIFLLILSAIFLLAFLLRLFSLPKFSDVEIVVLSLGIMLLSFSYLSGLSFPSHPEKDISVEEAAIGIVILALTALIYIDSCIRPLYFFLFAKNTKDPLEDYKRKKVVIRAVPFLMVYVLLIGILIALPGYDYYREPTSNPLIKILFLLWIIDFTRRGFSLIITYLPALALWGSRSHLDEYIADPDLMGLFYKPTGESRNVMAGYVLLTLAVFLVNRQFLHYADVVVLYTMYLSADFFSGIMRNRNRSTDATRTP